jgi:predicted secreted protein
MLKQKRTKKLIKSNLWVRIKWVPGLTILIICVLLLIGCGSDGASHTNHAPVISAVTADKEVVLCSQDCEISCVASDPDGDTLTYQWAANSGSISGRSPTATWTAPDVAGTYAITIAVSDSNDGQSTSYLSIKVAEARGPTIEDLIVTPRFSKNPNPEEMYVSEGELCDIECVASGQDGDELTYKWSIDGGSLSGADSTVTWKASSVEGTYNVTVLVTDRQGGESRASVAIDVRTNHQPSIDRLTISGDSKTFNLDHMKIVIGTSCEIKCRASDPDDDELSYEWSVEAANEAQTAVGSISEDDNIAIYEAPDRAPSKVIVTVIVSDGRGGTDTESLVLYVVTNSNCVLNK